MFNACNTVAELPIAMLSWPTNEKRFIERLKEQWILHTWDAENEEGQIRFQKLLEPWERDEQFTYQTLGQKWWQWQRR